MKALNHPNIVKLYEVIDTEEVYFLMEHVSKGDMFDDLWNCGHVSEKEAQGIFQQLVSMV